MNETPEHAPVIESWDTYWQGAGATDAFTGGGAAHPLVGAFWVHYFSNIRARGDEPRVIDIASGSGAVVECASTVFVDGLPDFTCLDVSDAAIRMLEERFPGVHGVVSDAASVALDSGSYDIVTSQFGVEYAGLDAVDELLRLLATSGELALLLHHRDGVIFDQCVASLDAIEKMQASGFIPRCIAVFETGYAAQKGGDREPYSAAGREFAPAISAMEDIIRQHGTEVADGTILKLYRDVRNIHGRMQHYEPGEIIAWLERMQDEVVAFAGRMASMRDVAIDSERFDRLCADLTEKGLEILRAEPLASADDAPPLAWALVAKKQ